MTPLASYICGYFGLLYLVPTDIGCDDDSPLGPVVGIAYDGQSVVPTQGIYEGARTETASTVLKDLGV